MQSLDVYRKDSGKIWQRKPSPTDNGLVVNITHSTASPFSLQGRSIRFLHVAFSTNGEAFAAGDHLGNVFVFDLGRNRFTLIHKTGTPCTAIAYSLRRKNEVLVGLADNSLRCYDTESHELVSWMKGHDSAISGISIHASGRYALTSSNTLAQLWDLDTFTRKRTLNGAQTVGIQQVFFLPLSNTIITCFKDDSIFAWDSETLQCKYQLPVPPDKQPHYRTLSTPRDGRTLVAGGRSRFLHVWALETKQLLHVIQLPAKVRLVKQLEFVPNSFDGGSSQTVGVVSQDGIARFINIHSCKLIFDIGNQDEMVSSLSISPNGRYIAAVMDSGSVSVYSIPALTRQLNKPPPPLLKAVEEGGAGSRQTSTSVLSGPGLNRSIVSKFPKKNPSARLSRNNVSAAWTSPDSGLEQTELPEGLNRNRLMSILHGYGEFPAKYRNFIWRSVLRLPENHAAYSSLVDKGTHSAFAQIHEEYPIKSRKLLRVLQRALSALAHWSPIFGEADYLPLLAFPFIKLFQNNQLICFEMIATVLVNWSQHWFEFFPNPPVNVLGMAENVLAHHDKSLMQHFVQYNITSQMYAWPLLQSLLSEVLTKDEWLKMFDNVFSNHPSFLLLAVVAYTTCSRKALLQCTRKEDFQYYFHNRNALDVGAVIKEAYRLQDITPAEIHPKRMLEPFAPLTKGQYPVFNKYPKFVVDYQVQERERIRQEELEYLRQRQIAQEMKQQAEQRQQEEEAFYRQQELMLDAEDQRRHLIAEEESKLADQRTRLGAMKREVHLRELQLLDAVRRRFMHHQQTQKEAELRRLDDEIERKALLREQETRAAIEDAEIKGLELEAQKGMLQQDMLRDQLQSSFMQRTEQERHRKQQEMEDGLFKKNLDTVQGVDLDSQRVAQEELAKAQQRLSDVRMDHDVGLKTHYEDLNRELGQVKVARHTLENKEREEEISSLVRQLENKENDRTAAEFARLREQKALEAEAERRRMLLLGSRSHGDSSQSRTRLTDDETFERLRDIHRPCSGGAQRRPLANSQDNNVTTTTDSSTPPQQPTEPSFERRRKTFEERELELMSEVRDLRQRLAARRRQNPPPFYNGDS